MINSKNEKHNVYGTVLELYLLDSKKNNNIINRQKLICGINKNSLFNTFQQTDFSGNKLLKYFLKPQNNLKTGGKKTIKHYNRVNKKLYKKSIKKNNKKFNKQFNKKKSRKLNKRLKKYYKTFKK